jgi:nucleoside-diphosphate-sugar epimerase
MRVLVTGAKGFVGKNLIIFTPQAISLVYSTTSDALTN